MCPPPPPTDPSAALSIIDILGPPLTPAVLSWGVTRELTEEDLGLLEQASPLGQGTPAVAKLREVHHHLARLLAEGRRPVEVAAITGYSQSRISILKRDPAFGELLAYYTANNSLVYQSVHEKLAQVGTMAVEELRDKLEEGELTNGQLIEVAKFTLDRSVAPPKGGLGASGGGGGVIPALTIQFVSPAAQLPSSGVTLEGVLLPEAPPEGASGGRSREEPGGREPLEGTPRSTPSDPFPE